MSTQPGEAIKKTIQSLNDSLWIFAALTVIAESGGLAGISLKLCEIYPQLLVTALEPGQTPFLLAQANIKKSPHRNRVELRQQGIEDVQDQQKFDVSWIAQGFIADEHFLPGLKAIKSALKPGGMILTYGISSETLNRSMLVNRFGASLYGGLRTVQQLITQLSDAGFHDAKISGEVLAGYKVMTAVKPN